MLCAVALLSTICSSYRVQIPLPLATLPPLYPSKSKLCTLSSRLHHKPYKPHFVLLNKTKESENNLLTYPLQYVMMLALKGHKAKSQEMTVQKKLKIPVDST